MRFRNELVAVFAAAVVTAAVPAAGQQRFEPGSPRTPASWTADNGNGTYSNPLFYEEFSDPDVIRVGDTYYLTGTTMHTMPGLPVLRSMDLVNWELASYAFERLDLAPRFRLEGGEHIYGQGIWAPCIRYHEGTFYIFSNINGFGTQVYRSRSPEGPWQHNRLGTALYDLSVLFDDDGKIYAVSGVREIFLSELNSDITDEIPGTRRRIMERDSGMGEGLHFYKIDDRYYIVSAIPGAHTPMVCARADSLDGPWEVETLVAEESLGVPTGNTLRVARRNRRGRPDRPARPQLENEQEQASAPRRETEFEIIENDPNLGGGLTIHQGGIVDTPSGQWWSIIMQDHNSLGRVSCLCPITWHDGWPLFGLPGNLRRSPATWIKPGTGHRQAPTPLFVRSDDFDAGRLQPIWQWNHVPDDAKWSLEEKPGMLRLHSLPAPEFWWAKNTLTQRAVGPESIVTVEVDTSGMKSGDVAGLALLNYPYAWIGLARNDDGSQLQQFDQTTDQTVLESIDGERFWLRVHCDYDTELAQFSYSTDGTQFKDFGEPYTMVFQLTTFQGVRYSLFHFNTGDAPGGYVDFDNFTVDEPRPRGLTVPIPHGRTIRLLSAADGRVLGTKNGTLVTLTEAEAGAAAKFRVVDRGQGRIALESTAEQEGKFVSVSASGEEGKVMLQPGPAGEAATFQWIDLQRGDLQLMSLMTNRYLFADPHAPGTVSADAVGPRPDRKGGACFKWKLVEE
jgi:beta-xylosidase